MQWVGESPGDAAETWQHMPHAVEILIDPDVLNVLSIVKLHKLYKTILRHYTTVFEFIESSEVFLCIPKF